MFLKTKYFTQNSLINGLYLAFCFSAFIYLETLNITNELLNSIFALIAFYLFLTLNRVQLFWGGFFTALFWFWWVGISFIYYELSFLIPFIILSVAIIYGFLFLATTILNNIYARALLFFALSFINPFGFNWFKPELLMINSYFDTSKLAFALILLSLVLFITFKNKLFKLSSLLILVFTINISQTTLQMPPLNIYMPQFNINQSDKWDKALKKDIIALNISQIKHAVAENYDLVILPETAFPMLLNTSPSLMNQLKELSKSTTIITGSMYMDGDNYHNSTYLFQNGQMSVAHKVVLVPFGEKVPLPQFLTDWVNKIFFNGAKDYLTAQSPTDFEIKGIKFRNAICYEATTDTIYENVDKYVIAISNNAWFTPSIEPTLQKLLMKYYAQKYNVTIFSVVNNSANAIIF